MTALTPFERFVLAHIEASAALMSGLDLPDDPKTEPALAVLEARGLIVICNGNGWRRIYCEAVKALTPRIEAAA